MAEREEDVAFARFRATADPESLAKVFDLTAAKLLLVAMHLARDEAAAEDLVQETYLAAIDAAQRYDASRPVLPWLVGILTREARMAHRRKRRERGIEGDATAARGDPLEAAEAEELAEDVAKALDSLPENYRAVLILRFVHGLRSVQIARTLSRSPETVRTQVRRGLELLRNVLPKSLALPAALFIGSGRGLAAVRAAVLEKAAAVHVPLVVGVAAGIGGLFVMKKVAAVSVGVLLVGAVAYFGLREPEPTPTTAAGPVAFAEKPERSDEQKTGANAESRATPVERSPAPIASPTVVEPKSAELRGRCVAEETGAPLSGCRVALKGTHLNGGRSQRGREVPFKAPEPVLTEADGVFAVSFDPSTPSMITVTVESEGRVTAEGSWIDWSAGESRDLGEIRLPLGTRVTARVVDEAGLSVHDVEVTVEARPPVLNKQFADRPWFTARSKLDGSLTFEKLLPPGGWPVRVGAGHVLVKPRTLEVISGQALPEITIVVTKPDPNATLSGVVLDAAGLPIPRARVEAHLHKPEGGRGVQLGSAQTLADGTFLIRCNGEALEPVQLFCWSPGQLRPDIDPRKFSWGSPGIRLEGKRDVRGGVEIEVIEAGTGKPFEEYGVQCIRDPGRGAAGGRRNQIQHQGQPPEGKLRIALHGAGRYLLIVHPVRQGFVPSGPVFFSFDGEVTAPLRIEVGPPTTLVAKVIRRDGSPVHGTKVQLLQAFGDDKIELHTRMIRVDDLYGFGTSGTLALAVDEGETDADGIARLTTPRTTQVLAIRLLGPGHIPLLQERVSVTEREHALTIVVETGATLLGTLRPPGLMSKLAELDKRDARRRSGPGDDTRSGLVLVRVGAQGPQMMAIHEVAKDGSFRVTGIPQGSWEVAIRWTLSMGTMANSTATPLKTVSLVGDETKTVDLDGTRLLPGHVQGRILFDGGPAKGKNWFLVGRMDGSYGFQMGGSDLDAEGRFSPVVVPPGEYRLALYLYDPVSNKELPLFAPVRLRVGPGDELDRLFLLSRHTLRIRILESDGKTPRKGIRLHLKDESSWIKRAERTNDAGEVVLDPAPLVPIQVELRVPEMEDSESWRSLSEEERQKRTIRLGTAEARQDQRETRVDLVLPPNFK